MIDKYKNGITVQPGEHLHPHNDHDRSANKYWAEASAGDYTIIDTRGTNSGTLIVPAGMESNVTIEVSNYPYNKADVITDDKPELQPYTGADPYRQPFNNTERIPDHGDTVWSAVPAMSSNSAKFDLSAWAQIKLTFSGATEFHLELTKEVPAHSFYTDGMAAILAPLLQGIWDAIEAQKDWEHLLFQDENTDFYYEKIIEYPQDGGAPVITWVPLNGGPNPPVKPIPVVSKDRELRNLCYRAIADNAGAGFMNGHTLNLLQLWDTGASTAPTAPLLEIWYNITTNTAVTTPPALPAEAIPCQDFSEVREHKGEQTFTGHTGLLSLTPPADANLAEIQVRNGRVKYGFSASLHKESPYNFFEIELESLDEIQKFNLQPVSGSVDIAVDYYFIPNKPLANS